MTDAPILWWVRRDLRLADLPLIDAAARAGRPVLPVFLRDAALRNAPAAPRWRWGLGAARFAETLAERGLALTFRTGEPAVVLPSLAQEVGAADVWWTHLYDPSLREAEEEAADALRAAGIRAKAHPGHLLFEPWSIATKTGDPYRVYTPMWRAVRGRTVPDPAPAPGSLRGPDRPPESEALEDWDLGHDMHRGAEVVARHVTVGERAARERLDRFVEERMDRYQEARDMLAEDGTSGLSENLAYGEIGPATCWHAAGGERDRGGWSVGQETFLKELVWREFAYHLLHHYPHLPERNFKPEWDAFPWRGDNADAEAWRRARTGLRVVDAAMREMWVTGTMHNRARMLVASYLTKHLMTHWKVGHDFFAGHLIDWDVANNAMGWQWVAGSGPDASPFFRVFNPETQAEKFDPDGAYRDRWLAPDGEGASDTAAAFHDAVPRSWDLAAEGYPDAPIVSPAEGRERALGAYAARER